MSFPPPPPPVGVTLSGSYKDDPPPQSLPPPIPPPAPLPALKANGPSLTNSNRRPPSKDYYNRGSPGNGGRGYYTSNSHRDRSRDYRDRERDYRSQSGRRQYQSRSYY